MLASASMHIVVIVRRGDVQDGAGTAGVGHGTSAGLACKLAGGRRGVLDDLRIEHGLQYGVVEVVI